MKENKNYNVDHPSLLCYGCEGQDELPALNSTKIDPSSDLHKILQSKSRSLVDHIEAISGFHVNRLTIEYGLLLSNPEIPVLLFAKGLKLSKREVDRRFLEKSTNRKKILRYVVYEYKRRNMIFNEHIYLYLIL